MEGENILTQEGVKYTDKKPKLEKGRCTDKKREG